MPKKKASNETSFFRDRHPFETFEKIDSFTGMIDEFLKEDPFVKAPFVLQRMKDAKILQAKISI